EDDAQVGAFVLRLGHEAAVHVRMAARLVDEQAPHVVEVFERVPALGEDRRPLERSHAAGDDAERLAGGVVVGGRDHPRAARKRGSAAVRSRRSKCSSAYAAKSKSSSDSACWTTPHIASRKSDMKRKRTCTSSSPPP